MSPRVDTSGLMHADTYSAVLCGLSCIEIGMDALDYNVSVRIE